jgi:hypothetical protein
VNDNILGLRANITSKSLIYSTETDPHSRINLKTLGVQTILGVTEVTLVMGVTVIILTGDEGQFLYYKS